MKMADKRNALAELAKRLNCMNEGGDVKVEEALDTLSKCERIVAELVKIDGIKEYIYAGNTVFANEEFVDVFRKCRAIAEEEETEGGQSV